MARRRDGSVQTAAVPNRANTHKNLDLKLYRCMVIKVLYVDDPQNFTQKASNSRCLYDVIVLGGLGQGQIIKNCRLMAPYGGNNNYHELVLAATTKDLVKDALIDHDGDVVYVQFIQGNTGYPVIVGMDQGMRTPDIGATEDDGQIERKQFNGVYEEIDKNGNKTITYKSGSIENGVFIPNETETYKVVVSQENEIVTETFDSGMKIIKDGKTGKITFSADMIDLGSNVTDMVTKFSALASAFSTHTHTSGSPGAPTSPPAGPLPSSVGSQTVKVQD